MFAGLTLFTPDYDALLNGWNTQFPGQGPIPDSVKFSGGNSNYCSAVNARDSLVNVYHWVITDDGEFCGNKWTGRFSSDWSDPDNWNNTDLEAEDEEDPTKERDVRIPMLNGSRPYPIITVYAQCKTIELQAGSELTIQAGRLDVSEL